MLAATSVWWRVLWAWWRRCGRSSCRKGLVDMTPPPRGMPSRRRQTPAACRRRPSWGSRLDVSTTSDVRQSLCVREAHLRGDWEPPTPRSSDTNHDIFHDQLQQHHRRSTHHSSIFQAHHGHNIDNVCFRWYATYLKSTLRNKIQADINTT